MPSRTPLPRPALPLAAAALVLTACGGAGDEASTPPALAPAPGPTGPEPVPGQAPAADAGATGALAHGSTAPEAAPLGPLFATLDPARRPAFRHDRGVEGNRELPETMGNGVAFLDRDGDGHLDLYVSQSGPLRELDGSEDRAGAENELWAGDGTGGFALVPGQAADDGYGQGVHAADLDGDGRPDLVSLNWGPDRVYHNAPAGPDGTDADFRDVTAAWGLDGVDAWSVSAAVLDHDADGDLDLYVVHYLDVAPRAHLDPRYNPDAPAGHKGYPNPDRYPAMPDRLWRNDLAEGRGFVDVTDAMGVAELDPQKGLGAIPTDIELDGWVDLYVANDATPNMLLHNRGGEVFEERARALGLAYNDSGDTEAGMGVDTLDVDRDGDLDLFVTNLDMETNSLYLNRSFERARGAAPTEPATPGRLAFRDRTLRMGLASPSRGYVGFGVTFSDLDLDGDGDVVVVNGHVVDNIEEISDTRLYAQSNQAYLNDGTGKYAEAGPELLPEAFRRPTVSRGSALGDLDGDLDLDLAVGNNGGPVDLYAGTPPDRPRLALRLVGPGRNTEGLGATVRLVHAGAPTWLGRMERSRSYASSSEALVVVGLPGPLEAVEVLWPGGTWERFTGEAITLGPTGGALTLRHGTGE